MIFLGYDAQEVSTENEALAKINDDNIHLIRMNSGGEPFNPQALYGNKGNHLKEENARPIYPFKRVTESIYNKYVDFLKTKNERHLTNATRELLNG